MLDFLKFLLYYYFCLEVSFHWHTGTQLLKISKNRRKIVYDGACSQWHCKQISFEFAKIKELVGQATQNQKRNLVYQIYKKESFNVCTKLKLPVKVIFPDGNYMFKVNNRNTRTVSFWWLYC